MLRPRRRGVPVHEPDGAMMKLQSKLIGGCAAMAVVTIAVAALGYWQAREFGPAAQRGVNTVVLGVAIGGSVAMVGLAVVLSRRVNRPVIEMADAMDRVSRGDFNVRVPVHAGDEFERMGMALNRMIGSLQSTETRLRLISDNLPNSLVYQLVRESDGSLRFLYISAGVERLHGITAEAVLADYRAAFHQFLEEDRGLIAAAREASLEEMRVFNVVVRCRTADGQLRWMNLCATPRRLADGRIAWDGIETDVTELKEATYRLQDSEARFRAVVENSGDAIVTSKSGRIIFANAAFASLFGHGGVDEVIDRPLLDFIAPGSRPQLAADSRSREHGSLPAARCELQAMKRDGTVFEVELRMSGFSFGGERFVVTSLRDITERKQTEAQRVETVRLREQLLQAQKMETLGTLAAGIAHDFNNLLTGITGFVELAASALPPGHEAGEMLKSAKQGATNARDLVRRILTFSRRSRETRKGPLDVGAFVRETTPLLAAVLPSNVSVDVAIADRLPSVTADAGQLQQVLINLCTNGAHAMATKPGMLRVAVEGVSAPAPEGGAAGRYVRISVSDTGAGLDESARSRLFTPFFTTKREGPGPGLGLFIVQDIVTRHRGWIDVSSRVGEGSTFSVYLPVAAESAAPMPVPGTTPSTRDAAGRQVMVVDDDDAIAAVLRLALKRGGYLPQVFTSPAAAWARFAQSPGEFDLVMVDQHMPELSGAELIAKIRSVAASVPVILMSGRFEVADGAGESLGAGVSTLKKPFDITDVLALVEATIGK